MLISQRLEQFAHEHDGAHRAIALYLIDQSARFEKLTMADIAAEIFTSKPTLVRFAKQLGFSGWREFSQAYGREIDRVERNAPDVNHSLPFSPGAFPADIARSIAQVRSDATVRTAERLDVRELERAARLLYEAKRIFLMGYGFNEPALKSFMRKLFQIGIAAIMPDQDNFEHTMKRAGADDCLVVVSYAGTGKSNLTRCLPEAREHGAHVVALTSEGENFLRTHADVTLSILSLERLFEKIGAFSTEASAGYLLDALYGCIFVRDYERNLRNKTGYSQSVETNRRPDA